MDKEIESFLDQVFSLFSLRLEMYLFGILIKSQTLVTFLKFVVDRGNSLKEIIQLLIDRISAQ